MTKFMIKNKTDAWKTNGWFVNWKMYEDDEELSNMSIPFAVVWLWDIAILAVVLDWMRVLN